MKRNWILPGLFLALIMALWTVAGPIGASRAYAQCSSGCGTPPPSCGCTPTPPTPPTPPCNCTPTVRVPGVRVYVSPSVVVNASVTANASASANAAGQGGAIVVGGGGASAYTFASPGAVNYVQGLNVQTGLAKSAKVAFQNTRTKTSRIVIRASCLDDKDVPHPASQAIPDKMVDDSYEGEIFRCIAGTTIQYVYGDYSGSDEFQGGTTVVCKKGDAIWYSPAKPGAGSKAVAGGSVSCKTQIPARDCNERSLLRRFGAGVKVVDVTLSESYTDYREETVSQESSSTTNLTLDGGVGGYTY